MPENRPAEKKKGKNAPIEKSTDQETRNAHQALIFSLAKLAESRDPDTGAHIQRVREYCLLVAERLGERAQFKDVITPAFLEGIYTAAPLHDIGKAAIPEEILLKAGKLTTEEFQVMKTHARLGAEALENALQFSSHGMFRIAYNIILYHHENFDGQGYPEGLYGDQIPLEARIMAVADVYDALVSRRVYKPPYGRDETYLAIQRQSGKKFDPVIAEIALTNMSAFERIYLQTT